MSTAKVRKSNRRIQTTAASRRQYVLDVKMRQSTARKVRQHRISSWVWTSLLWIGLLGASAVSIQTLLEKFFFKNPDYNLAQIQTDLNGVMKREEAITLTGLREGQNLFSVNLDAAQRSLLKIPEIQSATVERELPSTIHIQIKPRSPVAWISSSDGPESDPGNFENCHLVDAEGFVYKPWQVRAEQTMLPVIYGIETDDMSTGNSLNHDDLRAALTLLAANQRRPDTQLIIRSLDLRKGYCIDVINERNSHFIFGTHDFDEQLDRLQKLLSYSMENTREIESVNLIPKRNTPVRFLMAAVPEPIKPSSKKR